MKREVGLCAVVGATGIVYGDIGTSPLYAFEKSVEAAGSHDVASILGLLSLIFWALILSVTIKYVVIIMRADNDGEGGVLALLALVQRQFTGAPGRGMQFLVGCALAGTALFFCDSMITPAISVLSAVEGLELMEPGFATMVIPITLGVLALLFFIQRRGTAHISKLFGPIMVLWFVCARRVRRGSRSRASRRCSRRSIRRRASRFSSTHPLQALAIIGAVFLSLTGAEALYADMGHFGKTPVRIAWFALVLPSLLLNYYGQGALFLEAGDVVRAAAVHDGADAGAAVHDHPRDGGDGDRVTGCDFRRVLGCAAGRAARSAAAASHPADVGGRAGADLRAFGERAAVRRGGRVRARVQELRCAVGRVRCGGDRHDDR